MRIITLFVVALAACHSGHTIGSTDEVLGDPCTGDLDCAHRCLLDNNDHYPGGICSVDCISNADCPNDALCVRGGGGGGGGVCLFTCSFNCSFLGPQWQCGQRNAVPGGGNASVCIGNP